MILHTHNQLRQPQRIPATRLLVTHDNGTPLALLLDHGNGELTISTVNEPEEFQRTLRQYGFIQAVEIKTQLIGETGFSLLP